jgi:nucleotide-binding universal stress UspA family protein
MSTLLVATDGSKNALRALQFALDLAGQMKAKIHLIYVQPKVSPSRLVSRALIEEHYDRQTKIAFADAMRLIPRSRVQVKTQRVLGDPAPTIVAYARRHRCSQIILGNRGHGTLKGLLVGSVALKVIHLSDVPVTLVK